MPLAAKIRVDSNIEGKFCASWTIEAPGETIDHPDATLFFDTKEEADQEARRQISKWHRDALNKKLYGSELTIFVESII